MNCPISLSKSTGGSVSRIFPPGGISRSEAPGEMLTYLSPIRPRVRMDAIASSCSAMSLRTAIRTTAL